jgi:hypothetical protein
MKTGGRRGAWPAETIEGGSSMRATRILVLIAVLAVALAPNIGLACDKEGKNVADNGAKAGCTKTGCAKGAKAAVLAAKAEAGCQESAAALIAMAKEASCAKTAALAAKAEAGDQNAKKAIIAMYKASDEAEPSLAELATWAEQGCKHSAAALIARAKASDCAETKALAAKAEAGNEKSKAELIAMFKKGEETAK